MRGELLFVKRPGRNYTKWAVFYTILVISLFFGMYQVAAHVRTHGLPVGSMELSVPYSKYVLGEEITFNLTNNFNSVVFISNNCPGEPLAVYKQINGRWIRQHATTSEENCVEEARSIGIAPQDDVKGSFAKWKNLFATTGKYRIVAYVEYYNALPYADFEIVDKSTVTNNSPGSGISAITNAKSSASSKSSGSSSSTWSPAPAQTSTSVGSTSGGTSGGSSGGGSGTVTAPKTVTVNVNSAGNYSLTSVNLNAGDSIRFVYSAPIGDEVITSFTRLSGTATIASLKLDHDVTSGIRTFSSAGKWTFKALDHSGNTGTITVN